VRSAHADFRNVILVMTTNAGGQELSRAIIGFGATSILSLQQTFGQRQQPGKEVSLRRTPRRVPARIAADVALRLKRTTGRLAVLSPAWTRLEPP